MYTVNFKKRPGILIILAAVLLSGCQTKNESSQGEIPDVSSVRPYVSSTVPIENSTSSVQPEESSSVASSAQPIESSDFSLPEEPPYSEPPERFPADRVYPDDEVVPSEWIRVNTTAEVREKIDEVLRADTSAKDPENALPALMNKHVLCFDMFNGSLLPTNLDAPYNSSDFEKPIYPLTSEYFSNLHSILDLVYDTYKSSIAEERLHSYYNGEPLFTEIKGQLYKNANVFPIWSSNPFAARTYVEITEKTENKCTFIWHFPDEETSYYPEDIRTPPESGYEFFYHEKTYTAEYIDGSWKLDSIVIDG